MLKTFKRWFPVLGILLLPLFMGSGNVPAAHAATPVTVWLQAMDSCKEALPGANFILVAPDGAQVNAGPTAGTKRRTVSSGSCPLPRGNCQTVPTGCLTWVITPPASGVDTYTIQENPTWDASDGFFENPPGPIALSGFVPCTGGSACQSQSATFTVDSNGVVSGVTTNIYPDGTTSQYPKTGTGTSTGTQTDPIVFHNFQLGDGSISCDNDHDADDYLTGSPSVHCDNDADH